MDVKTIHANISCVIVFLVFACCSLRYAISESVNYLLIKDHLLYFLGLCNSKVLNWFFAKLSTNNNVNGYEVDNLPVRMGNELQVDTVERTVKALLETPDDEMLKKQLDSMIYEIYGLSANEQMVVEKQTM